jgi:hypothetical protein
MGVEIGTYGTVSIKPKDSVQNADLDPYVIELLGLRNRDSDHPDLDLAPYLPSTCKKVRKTFISTI